MGNCSLKGDVVAKGLDSIRVMTDSGRILHTEGPKLVGEVLKDFPGHGIFGRGHFSSPLFDHEQLLSGHFYYLLPLGEETKGWESNGSKGLNSEGLNEAEPVRMSSSEALDTLTRNLTRRSALEVLPSPRKGVWRVKLVIDTKQLEEILSEQENTEALIEQMRMAASSAKVKSNRMRSYWGMSLKLKPILSNVFKMPIDHHNEVQSAAV